MYGDLKQISRFPPDFKKNVEKRWMTHLPFTSETPSWYSRSWQCKRSEWVESPWPRPLASWSRDLEPAVALQTTSCPVENGRPRSARPPRDGPAFEHSILAPTKSQSPNPDVFTRFLETERSWRRSNSTADFHCQKILTPSIHTDSIGTQGHKTQHKDRQEDPARDQHQIMIRTATKNARILQNATQAIGMFVAHHWCQGCSTHGGKSHLKEGTNAANDFGSIPVVPFCKEFGHSKANSEPSHTHREDQGAQEIADGFGLTCVPVRRWTFPVSSGEVVVFALYNWGYQGVLIRCIIMYPAVTVYLKMRALKSHQDVRLVCSIGKR